MNPKQTYLKEEVEWIQNSGEIPEVAFYTSLYYLTKKEDGPKLTLSASDIKCLEDAVIHRYKTIILRDLNYSNRGSDSFRGIKRAIVNYNRLKNYLSGKNRLIPGWKKEIRQAFLTYLNLEYRDISDGRAYRTINCDREELEQFARELGVDLNTENLDLCFTQVPLTFEEVYRVTLLSEMKDYPFKLVYDRGDHFEVVILNEGRKQFPFTLKVFYGQAQSEKQQIRLKVDAIYRSIPKLPAPWKD
ncbi:MAG TPA: hypothetical protein EYP21_04050 [Syntrophaceae bacterium]|nr:hypothetical protein [Syntrophaceae bacterium]